MHISSNFLLSVCLLIQSDALLLVPPLHCNTSLHFTTLHPTTLHYTYRQFTSSHLHFTTFSFGLTHLRTFPIFLFHQRPYHVGNTGCRLITAVKQRWAWLVLGWVTVPLSWNLGTLTSWNLVGHSRSVTGLLYLYLYLSFYFTTHHLLTRHICSLSACWISSLMAIYRNSTPNTDKTGNLRIT